jgi:hypothetical protein
MLIATIMLIAIFAVPDINRTNRIIAGDDVVSYYGLPKPDIYEGE